MQRLWLLVHPERTGTLLTNHTSHVFAPAHSSTWTRPGIPSQLRRVPGNQVLNLSIQEKELVIPRLATEHEGLRIAHLTDLHMSGRLTRAFYEHIVDRNKPARRRYRRDHRRHR